ncbi:MAG: S41 family peptidase [Bacillota bacterium]
MISKKTALIWAAILVIVTSMLTYILTNTMAMTFGGMKLITREQYNDVRKLLSLKNEIHKFYVDGAKDEVLMEGAIKGMFEALGDPYSIYMDEEEFKSFNETTSGSYGGIGVIITKSEEGYITVVAPIEGTPGERVGLKTNDKIVKVNGEDIVGWDSDKAVKVMKGEPGTKVKLTVMRDGADEPLVFELTREMINIKYVTDKILENDIGYIRISMFDEDTGEEFSKSLKRLTDAKIKGLIIDLRQNPGGYVRECMEVADELLDEGVVFYAEDKSKDRETYKSREGKLKIPFVILVDEGSASASEIVSGAVKDRKAGLIIGTRTFGKGLVQNIKDLRDGSGYKLTVQKYFTPSGISINKVGVEPDIVVEALEPEDNQRAEDIKDVQLDRAIEEILKRIK